MLKTSLSEPQPQPQKEEARLKELYSLHLLDSFPEPAFDDLTFLASQICGMPVAYVGLIDRNRQWIKSKIGIDISETVRDTVFCAHAILKPTELLIVNDAAKDSRFSDNPLVTSAPNICFYVGMPLVTQNGHSLGVLCVVDRVPRQISKIQQTALRTIASQLMAQIELRNHLKTLRRTEAVLREQANLLDLAHDTIMVRDMHGRVVFWNRGAELMYGLRKEEVLGKVSYEILQTQFPGPLDEIEAKLQREGYWEGELTNTGRYGMQVAVASRWVLQRNELGEPAAILEINNNITSQKRIEHELAESRDTAINSARAKSEFLAHMSHEIRTPMNGIIGMSAFLMETALNPEQHEFASTIKSCGDSLLRIINDVLDFSKIESGKLAFESINFNLGPVVESALDIVTEQAHKKGLELAALIHRDVPVNLRGDPHRLQQVLINLLGNAVKFTEKGEVVVSVSVENRTQTDVMLRFSVKDTGLGITEEQQKRLFQPYSQADESTARQYGGTGLGLTIVRQLVHFMGGEAGIESIPGQGSTFWFTALLLRQARGLTAVHAAQKDLSGLRVLIVDDHSTSRQVLQHQLSHCHVHTEAVATGAEALRILRQQANRQAHAARTLDTAGTEALERAGAHLSFDVVLLDLHMPEMNGLDLAIAIKSDPALSAVRLVMMTLRGSPSEKTKHTEIDAYLTKPVKQSLLYECLVNVTSHLRNHPEQQAGERHAIHRADTKELVKSIRLLLAEDNAVNQKVALRLLAKLGYAADVVNNGIEVLNSLERIPYHIVLMDCMMPELNGYETTKRIRQREGNSKHTVIIAITAHAMDADREACLAAGMDDYLSKPISFEALKTMLDHWSIATWNSVGKDHILDLIDLSVLNASLGGDLVQQRELIEFFQTHTTQQFELLHQALEEKSFSTAERIAHGCAGSSATCGLKTLAPLFNDIENAARQEKFDDALSCYERAKLEYERVKEAFRGVLSKELQQEKQ